MKAKRDHRVPLSGRALAILHDVQRLSDGTSLVFRSLRGKPLSHTRPSRLSGKRQAGSVQQIVHARMKLKVKIATWKR